MKYLIVAVLLSVVQAIMPVPHQAEDNHAGNQGRQNAHTSQNKSSPSAPSQPAFNPADQKTTGDANQDKNNEVKVSSLPPEIGVKTVKDRIDWTILGCTVILTIVGIVGTCAAIKTLKAINRQAHYMLIHADHLDKLAKAARDNATAALLNAQAASKSVDAIIRSERAWVIAELFPMAKRKSGQYFRWVGGGNAVPMEPERILRGEHLRHGLKFVNMGRTMARITAFESHCGFYDHKRDALRVERIDYNGDYNRMLAAGDEVSTDVVIDIHEFVHNPSAEIGLQLGRIGWLCWFLLPTIMSLSARGLKTKYFALFSTFRLRLCAG
jgi:hypothetical protein